MAISGKDNIVKWVRMNDAPYWKIFPYGASRNNCLACSDDTPSLSMDSSIEKLETTLDLLGTGRYVVCAKKTEGQTKGFFEIPFEHSNGSAMQPSQVNGANNSIQGGSSIMEIMEMRMSAKISELETKFAMERIMDRNRILEEENKILKEGGLESTVNNVIKRLDPYTEPILDHFFPVEKKATIAVAGFNESIQTNRKDITTMTNTNTFTPPNTAAKNDEEASKRANAAIDFWARKDPENFLLVVEKIAFTISENPQMYNTYTAMLLK